MLIEKLDGFQKRHPKIFKKLWSNSNFITNKFVHLTGFNPKEAKFADVVEYMERVKQIDPAVFFQLVLDLNNFDRSIYGNIKQLLQICFFSR